MKKFYLAFFCSLLVAFSVRAQTPAEIDKQNDTAESALNQNPKDVLIQAEKIKAVAEAIGYKKGMAKAIAIMGVANYKIDDYAKAKILISDAVTINQQISDTSNLAFCKYWLGNIELNQSKYNNALDLFQATYELAEKINDKKNIARSLDGKASIYEALGEDDKALTLYQAALEAAKQGNFNVWYPGVMQSMGNLAYKKGKVDSAIKIYNEAIIASDEVGNLNNKANCYQKLAEIYYGKKQSKRAMEYIQQAMALFQQTGSMSSFSYSRLLMSYILLSDRAYKVAIDLAEMSLEEGKSTGEIQLQKDAAQVLYYAYLGMGDKGKALDYHILFHELSEANNNETLTKKLVSMELEANFEKERQIAKVEEAKRDAELGAQIDKQRLVKKFAIIGIFLFAIIAGLAIFAFNQKRKDSSLIAREKKRTDALLLNILPEEIVNDLKKAEYKVNGQATVLFADIKTQAGKTPGNPFVKPIVSELDYYYRAFDEIAARHKIERIKTVGDAYLCISSAAVSEEDNAYNVTNAALEIIRFVKQAQQPKADNGESFFEISIGIHTGPVIAGIIGIRKFSYDVWGDTVNIAARMEQHGEEGKINISGGTYKLVKNRFICVFRGEMETKKKEKIDMYFVERAAV
jgi:class 3 adenylate cyclase/Tfp pilus assembly protein PilF